ncbi:hypothetical protein AQJ23_00110 [Streptomyces antibioticus]|nr:hypothetical protein [Streptomyces antibioticus]KUN29238.1 hypothetical protein AQJ23_00110 [Streptomyces antibioticus]
MDVEEAIDALYGLRPEEFVAARDALVAQARREKDTAAARRIAALRRPTLAAWASNLFARQRPEEATRLLELGETLRQAHRTLDAGQLRQASRQQHQMITLLARETAALAQQAGLPLTEAVRHEVEQILHGVLADPQVAEEWAAARLTKAPAATVDFTAVTPEALPERPQPPVATTPAPTRGTQSRTAKSDRRGEARRERVKRARARSEEAAAQARRSQDALTEAQDAKQAADARAGRARDRVSELEEQLQAVRDELREATEAAGLADTAVKDAARAVDKARRNADRASRELAKLSEDTDEV